MVPKNLKRYFDEFRFDAYVTAQFDLVLFSVALSRVLLLSLFGAFTLKLLTKDK